jgi:hypothetical protein
MWRILPTLAILPMVAACVAQPATTPPSSPPKPVLVLTEWNDWGGAGHPWPIELRLVAYDNGLVIWQPLKNNDPLTRPSFVWQQKTPAEVFALAAEAKAADLDGVRISDETVSLPLHMGMTDLWYSDPEKPELVKLTAYGMPCAATEEDLKYEWTSVLLKATNPRFLKLCDVLLRLPLADAKEWYPDAMKVELMAVDEKPDQLVAWPADWPQDRLSDSPIDGTIAEFCVPVGKRPAALTAAILDPQSEAWSQNIAADQTGPLWWVVLPYAARISMPGAIDTVASGPCLAAP